MAKKPEKLIEKSTNYNFLFFWDPSYSEECFENDGGSSPRVRYPDNLRGLYVQASHYMCRGNSFGRVKLRDLVSYIQKETGTLKEIKTQDIPDMKVSEWLKELYKGNKKLRKNIGLDKIDIYQGTFVLLRMKDILKIEKSGIESLVSKVAKKSKKTKPYQQ